MLKLKFNWLSMLIIDGICGSLILSCFYNEITKHLIYKSDLIIILICFLALVFYHLFFAPFSFFFIDSGGIGSKIAIGLGNKILLNVINQYVKWNNIIKIDYQSGPVWNGLFIYYENKGFSINFYLFTNKLKAIQILLNKLPRNRMTENAINLFINKWENNFN
jgi:hypothetical protein